SLRTTYDPRNSATRDGSGQLTEQFGDKLYRAVIPRNVRLAEAPSYGMPELKYDRGSKGAVAYLALAGEMVRRHGSKKTSPAVAVEHRPPSGNQARSEWPRVGNECNWACGA